MSEYLEKVAIIGGGLGGCALALALSSHSVPVTVYESRVPTYEAFASGVLLTPNGLRVLDQLGVFARIKDRCFIPTHRVILNDKDETVSKIDVTDHESRYGYRIHRIWRRILLDTMRQMLVERSVEIKYDSRFNGIISDSTTGVDFMINDTVHHASLLIGSDGIYSSVRKHIAPGITPEYTGIMAVLSHIKRASVAWPSDDYARNATIQGKSDAIIFLPEDPEEKDIMVGLQIRYPQQSKGDLDRLQADKNKLADFYMKDHEQWGPTVRSIIDSVSKNRETLFIWPYLRMPTLQRWYSSTGRVVVMGDAAHALPPSSGQGINQALEDVSSFTLILNKVSELRTTNNKASVDKDKPAVSCDHMLEALSFWQSMRQERIDAVFDYATNVVNVQRMSDAEREKVLSERQSEKAGPGEDDMSWLYQPNVEETVTSWLYERRH